MSVLEIIVSDTEKLAIVFIFGAPLLVGTLFGLVSMYFSHQERMNLILQGIHPDHPPEDEESEQPEPEELASPSSETASLAS